MRALLVPAGSALAQGHEHTVIGDPAHHLIKVVRIRAGEEVALLDGNGLKAIGKVLALGKQDVTFMIQSVELVPRRDVLHLAIGAPKKEAFEEALRVAVECGIMRIIPLITEFSQREARNGERLERVLESALIQSNNRYRPEIPGPVELKDLARHMGPCQKLFFFDSQGEGSGLSEVLQAPVMMLIGPEGGFSPAERQMIRSFPGAHPLSLPTPILRTPTAVAAGAGYLLSRLK